MVVLLFGCDSGLFVMGNGRFFEKKLRKKLYKRGDISLHWEFFRLAHSALPRFCGPSSILPALSWRWGDLLHLQLSW